MPSSVDPAAGDPSRHDPSLLGAQRRLAFEFAADPDGRIVPLAAHIRKAYPRDTPTAFGGEADTQTHRLLRRGIPFGRSLPRDLPDDAATFPDDRGLVFACYQSSIARQFEWVQERFVNDPDFPRRGAGPDPVVGMVESGATISVPGARREHIDLVQRFVTTTGGGYFFTPSRSALRILATEA